MLLSLFFLFVAYACIYGLTHDLEVYGFILMVGFLQDPARKLMAGEPVYMTVTVGLIVACITARRLFLSQHSLAEPFLKWNSHITTPLGVYMLLVVLQGLHSLLRYGSPFMATLGGIFYVAPLIAIMIGYIQFNRFEVVRRFMIIFIMLAVTTAVSVVLSFSGVDSNLFGEVGEGLLIYDQGTILKAYSGLMRSSEIAGWHMGAGVCFLIVLLSDRGSIVSIAVAAATIVLLIAAIILTGRRKMILQIVVFASLYFPLLRYYQGAMSTRFVVLILSAIAVFAFFVYWFVPTQAATGYELYLARGTSVFGDAGDRFTSLGIGTINWAIRDQGLLGGGLGVATQGAQHFGGVGTGAGEGGLGKLVSELGVISLFIVPWLGVAIAKHLNKCIELTSNTLPKKLPFVCGVGAFLLANIPTFIVASQVYGDLFILLILGLLTGYLFSTPQMVVSELESSKANSNSRNKYQF